jgi:amino acid adenylation domain-containing protein
MGRVLSPERPINPAVSFNKYERKEIEQSIPERFEKILARYPERVAVKRRNGEFTYDELNRFADSVAHAILAQGVRNGAVGLLLEKDYPAIAAILGVLKAGSFYVPLDPSHPRSRLSAMLQDCQIGILITGRKYHGLAKNLTGGGCLLIRMEDLDSGRSAEDCRVDIAPDANAAVFYTSGSTGSPKGVIWTHRNILHRVMINTNAFQIRAEDRLTLLNSLSYSASLHSLFSALLNGAAVHCLDILEEGAAEVASRLAREKLTIYFSVPTVFRQLVRNLTGREDISSIRLVELIGECATIDDAELYKKCFPSNCILVNTMGATEAGVFRQYIINKSTDLHDPILPIGYEVEDKEILLVNENGEEIGFNQTGEILVRSEVLSPGYWRRPELTAAAFKPESNTPGKTIYHTGDLGCLLPDGCLLYRGRKDFRVKIRGISVEIEEIEVALQSHPCIEEAVVVTSNSPTVQLVAYVVPSGGADLTVSDMRKFLSEKLPEYMVPSSFAFLNALPRTPAGKPDRQALSQPNEWKPPLKAEFVPPQDQLERDLAHMCEAALQVHPIGIRDNLFDLGADSLTVVALVSQIEASLNTHMAPVTLMQAPTIEQLAAILRKTKRSGVWSSLVPIQPTGSKPPFFWVHGDISNAFLPRYLGADQPFYGLGHQSQDGNPANYTQVESIAAYYLREIRTVQANGPYFLGGYSFGAIVAFEVAQQMTRGGEEVALLVLLDPPNVGRSDVAFAHRPSFPDSVHRHLCHLVPLAPKEKMDYVFSRAAEKTRQIVDSRIAKARSLARRLTWRVCLATGSKLPVSVRSPYILDLYKRARARYLPQPYRGRTILFKLKSRLYDSVFDWPHVLQGALEIHELDGEHMQLREKSHVPLWAEKLATGLARAQRTHTTGSRMNSPLHLVLTSGPESCQGETQKTPPQVGSNRQ